MNIQKGLESHINAFVTQTADEQLSADFIGKTIEILGGNMNLRHIYCDTADFGLDTENVLDPFWNNEGWLDNFIGFFTSNKQQCVDMTIERYNDKVNGRDAIDVIQYEIDRNYKDACVYEAAKIRVGKLSPYQSIGASILFDGQYDHTDTSRFTRDEILEAMANDDEFEFGLPVVLAQICVGCVIEVICTKYAQFAVNNDWVSDKSAISA